MTPLSTVAISSYSEVSLLPDAVGHLIMFQVIEFHYNDIYTVQANVILTLLFAFPPRNLFFLLLLLLGRLRALELDF